MRATATPEAQAWFDQGLRLEHDFWDYEAAKAYEQGVRIDPNCVWLEVTKAARAPDSEVVTERLKLLASAIGIKRSEVVEIDAPSPLR